MSLSNDRSTVARIQKAISELQRKQAEETRKVAEHTKRMNSAMASASRSTSQSSVNSYLSTATRESKNIESAQAKLASYATDISRKTDELIRVQERVVSGEEKERRDTSAAYDKQRKQDETARKKLQDANASLVKDVASLKAQILAAIEQQASNTLSFVVENAEGEEQPYDFFISHAWADKEGFVEDFVQKAKHAGLNVWYDRQALDWGDSIRQKIDDGLRRSYFGVVVLSPNFFERPWTQYELDGIVQRDLSGQGRLLPIWHRLTQDDVAKHAPSLANRLALSTSNYSTDDIVTELVSMRGRFKALAN
jgi:hypothetical protein